MIYNLCTKKYRKETSYVAHVVSNYNHASKCNPNNSEYHSSHEGK